MKKFHTKGVGGGQRRFDICHKKVVFLNEGFPNLKGSILVLLSLTLSSYDLLCFIFERLLIQDFVGV